MPSGNAVQLRCVDDLGRSLLERRLTLPSRPVTEAIYDSVIARFLRTPGRTESDMRSRIPRPRNLPLVLDLVLDNAGNLWLARSHWSESTARWVRVRPDGMVRDTVTIPSRYRLVRLSNDTVWTASADADGLETLSRCLTRQ
jgi:hypothetical protein